jgi:hypothetical protein
MVFLPKYLLLLFSSFPTYFYPSQTKMLEGGTKDEIRMFEALFNGVSTRFGRRTIEKYVENPDFIFCSSFQHLRLVSITFSCHFRPRPESATLLLATMVITLHLEAHSEKLVRTSKIFVWGAYNWGGYTLELIR